ncbi:YqaJ-like viral recombinase [Methylobacterium sp. Leaf121]|nr:YqaJ-like viral recombinase [Methylobacterium sp. Leaf121]
MEMIDKAGMRPTVRIHHNLYQGTEEWLAARCGLLTASEMGLIITPATLKAAKNEKERAHLYELLAQRISGYVEPHFVSFDMVRGHEDEIEALALYAKHFAPTEAVGFVTNDKWGFTIGYSPDAFVGADGLVETKSRRQKYQIETFVVHVLAETIPADYVIQIQTGLLVTERAWCDLISYSGGLPLARIRAYPDPKIQAAIVEAAEGFETRLEEARAKYLEAIEKAGNIPTVRRVEGEILA